MVCQPGIGWVEINETLKEKGEHVLASDLKHQQ